MARKTKNTDANGAPVKTKRKRNYRRRQRNTSIFFLLWAVFSALSFLIVLLFGVTQQMVMTQTYKSEAARELSEKGGKIETAILKTPSSEFGGNRSALIRYLAMHYDLQVYILDETGEVLLPQEPDLDQNREELDETFDYSEEIETLKQRLTESGDSYVIYEGVGEYVYGAKISLYEDSEVYLYVAKSLDFIETSSKQMRVRMGLVTVFIFVLSFALSSAISGWFTRPLTEMTKKARQLARGDFDVDFHGDDYSQEMAALADTLNFARDELSKTDRMQKELIANVSHDFKTPLTMIKAYASMIIEISGDVPEKRNKHAQVIVEEADRLTSLVSDVLDLSKISSGIDGLKLTTFDMSAYLSEILDRFGYLRDTQGYVFETEIEEELYTRADELKIGQAVYNLIGNAVNYTGADKKVRVSLKKVSETEFRFAVTDTGAGIKPEEIPTIWDRYYRSAETHKRPVKGTGLGLSIVKTVLEKHGFVFGVESERGKGSTFYILFPAAPPQNNFV